MRIQPQRPVRVEGAERYVGRNAPVDKAKPLFYATFPGLPVAGQAGPWVPVLYDCQIESIIVTSTTIGTSDTSIIVSSGPMSAPVDYDALIIPDELQTISLGFNLAVRYWDVIRFRFGTAGGHSDILLVFMGDDLEVAEVA